MTEDNKEEYLVRGKTLNALPDLCIYSDIYNNSPVHYLSNMDCNHYYINEYNKKKMIAVVGQGSYEHLVLYSNYWLKDICSGKHINTWVDIRDNNSIHDWCSWKEYIGYYLNLLIA